MKTLLLATAAAAALCASAFVPSPADAAASSVLKQTQRVCAEYRNNWPPKRGVCIRWVVH